MTDPAGSPQPYGTAAGRATRWLRWLLFGIAIGIAVGFGAALARPRVERPGPDRSPQA